LFGRIAAFGIACDMLVAVAMIHWHFGFFANWTGQQKGEGFEYHILAIAMALAIMIKGSGALSVDAALSKSQSSSLSVGRTG
jgi:putative oxidoreductase